MTKEDLNFDADFDRLLELQDIAREKIVTLGDYDLADYLEGKDREEFIELFKKINGECPLCGGTRCKH